MRSLLLSLGLVALGASGSGCTSAPTEATAGLRGRKTDEVSRLLGSTQDADPMVARHAVAARAGARSRDDERAARACLEAVGDAQVVVRNAAVLALEQMGPRALSVLEELRERYFATKSTELRVRLARALRAIRADS